jgi:hypothetical protein
MSKALFGPVSTKLHGDPSGREGPSRFEPAFRDTDSILGLGADNPGRIGHP